MYETTGAAAIAGSFRAGFGQRLVFDSSGRAAPNGLYFDDEVTYTRTSRSSAARSPASSSRRRARAPRPGAA